MSANKRPLILFSGGVDSTFLLWHTLVEEKNPCDVIYADGGQGPVKMVAEKRARELIFDWFRKNAPDNCPSFHDLSVKSNTYIGDQGGAFRQPLCWLVAAMEAFEPDRHSGVEIAYIAGDQINPHLHLLENAWQSLLPVCKKIEEKAELTFPLKFHTKAYILHHLPEELYKLTWVCETPMQADDVYLPCNSCAACLTRQVEAFRCKLSRGRVIPQTVWGEEMKVLGPEVDDSVKEPEMLIP